MSVTPRIRYDRIYNIEEFLYLSQSIQYIYCRSLHDKNNNNGIIVENIFFVKSIRISAKHFLTMHTEVAK